MLVGSGQIGNHEPAAIIAVAEHQRHRLVRGHRFPQTVQLGGRLAILTMKVEFQGDFVQLIADKLHARFPFNTGMAGVIHAHRTFKFVPVSDDVKFYFA